jgi:hypothetical protein
MNHRWHCALVVCLLISATGQAFAQVSDVRRVQEYRVEQEQIKQLEGTIPLETVTSFDWGGWYNFSFTHFDGPYKDRAVVDHDLRFWGSFTFDDVFQVYARGRIDFINWVEGRSPDGRKSDVDGFNLDEGWATFRLGRLLNKSHTLSSLDADVKVGRQYIEIGRGVVLAQIIDATRLDVGNYYFHTTFFAGESVRSTMNLDASAPGFWHDDREFYGIQGEATVCRNLRPYLFILWVNDRNNADTTTFLDNFGHRMFQSYGYSPTYLGLGSHGNVIPNMRYWVEYIWEWGQTASLNSTEDDRIDGHAITAGVEYMLNRVYSKPRFEYEFGWGSGDSRRRSPNNTVNGVPAGHRDHGFLAYGYFDTGAAFAARLANLTVNRFTASCRPLEKWECLRNLETGISLYIFDKVTPEGGITDFTADLPERDLGHEVDLFANCRITSDLLWTIRWGHFSPGGAYSDQSGRNYLYTGVTLSF